MSGKAPTRSYVSTLRTEQAATTRRRILEAAAACFTENGYSGTSLADIAARAGVSPETVKNNGPKRELLLGAFEQAFAGTEGPAPVVDSDPAQEILAITDADAFLTATAAFVAAANARTSVLWIEFLAAANADALVAAALDDLLARRRADYRGVVEQLIERGIAIRRRRRRRSRRHPVIPLVAREPPAAGAAGRVGDGALRAVARRRGPEAAVR